MAQLELISAPAFQVQTQYLSSSAETSTGLSWINAMPVSHLGGGCVKRPRLEYAASGLRVAFLGPGSLAGWSLISARLPLY